MIRKILFLSFLLSLNAQADDLTEDAVILNQEMKFLEDSAKGATVPKSNRPEDIERRERLNNESLEERYFGNETDEIRTRTAAPKRRSY